MSKINNKSPLRYPGGKTRACKILDKIVNDNFDIENIQFIISPFLGGGSFEFYMQNIFFIGDKDREEFVFGCNMGVEITPIISLIIDLSQVYYDSDLDGDTMHELEFLNFGLNIGANF